MYGSNHVPRRVTSLVFRPSIRHPDWHNELQEMQQRLVQEGEKLIPELKLACPVHNPIYSNYVISKKGVHPHEVLSCHCSAHLNRWNELALQAKEALYEYHDEHDRINLIVDLPDLFHGPACEPEHEFALIWLPYLTSMWLNSVMIDMRFHFMLYTAHSSEGDNGRDVTFDPLTLTEEVKNFVTHHDPRAIILEIAPLCIPQHLKRNHPARRAMRHNFMLYRTMCLQMAETVRIASPSELVPNYQPHNPCTSVYTMQHCGFSYLEP
jgi:hypothetical protein